VLLTKADKLSRNEAARSLAAAQKVLGDLATDHADISMVLFSALSRQGLGDAALVLRQWQAATPAPQDGAADPADPAGPAAGLPLSPP
jgi:GTP-binding protein